MALTEREVFKEQVGKKMMSQDCHLSANSADLFSKHALFPLKVSPLFLSQSLLGMIKGENVE